MRRLSWAPRLSHDGNREVKWTPTHIPEIAQATLQHLGLSVGAVAIGLALALLVGVPSARRPRVYAIALTACNFVFVIPSLALFALLIPYVGLGTKPALIGLTLYCLLILLRNVVTGLRTVSEDVLDAADGMGLHPIQRLLAVELPLALPLIVSGIRIALVTTIGIATVAAFIDAGGLGTIILSGIDQNYTEKILVGGGLTAFLAIACDLALSRAEKSLTPWR